MIIIKKEDISKLISEYKNNGLSIVFTNGCFDLLHSGHLDLLRRASEFGDKLIVGLNSDVSVKKLKGRSRPIENESVRSNNLLDKGFVDDVIIFNEITPKKLIEQIIPNVLVKGGDYKKEEIVGYNNVTKNGGVVRIVPLTPGFSTTLIINKSNR
ncbi:adenylyltransferase/cytidyltransferase family protein [Candidatus Marinimicrobia bacterium]|nr:adenylyltransferase/cytidyltransferase family protein [Candidatus Neomarinimicrobiota bacterium]|tara:strand:+ start:5610 stop:6074 length:465 start_codon:yes stop_codon:yes gene_type:complete